MSGIDGAIRAFDYRPHEVLVGYSSISGVGVEYKSGGAAAAVSPLPH